MNAFQVLRALSSTADQMTLILQPFGNQFPSTEPKLSQLIANLRRRGHIIDSHPGNVTGPTRQAGPGAYYGKEHQGDEQQVFFGVQPWSMPPIDPTGGWSHPEASDSTGGWGPVSPEAPAAGTYTAQPVREDSSGAETDTSSDSGNEMLEPLCYVGMTAPQIAEAIYMQYRQAEERRRRCAGKPVRKVRRGFKKHRKGSGRGHKGGRYSSWGQGNNRIFALFTEVEVQALLSSKGKEQRKGSSGKGFGRKGNPKNRLVSPGPL